MRLDLGASKRRERSGGHFVVVSARLAKADRDWRGGR
jgi:hypothetical protein